MGTGIWEEVWQIPKPHVAQITLELSPGVAHLEITQAPQEEQQGLHLMQVIKKRMLDHLKVLVTTEALGEMSEIIIPIIILTTIHTTTLVATITHQAEPQDSLEAILVAQVVHTELVEDDSLGNY